MSVNEYEPLSVICTQPNPVLYTLSINLENLNILQFDLDINWALFIAYNRGKMDKISSSDLYQHYAQLTNNIDLLIGHSANECSFILLDRFFNDVITDVALFHALSAIKAEKQYVALTQSACNQIYVMDKNCFSSDELIRHTIQARQHRADSLAMAETIVNNIDEKDVILMKFCQMRIYYD